MYLFTNFTRSIVVVLCVIFYVCAVCFTAMYWIHRTMAGQGSTWPTIHVTCPKSELFDPLTHKATEKKQNFSTPFDVTPGTIRRICFVQFGSVFRSKSSITFQRLPNEIAIYATCGLFERTCRYLHKISTLTWHNVLSGTHPPYQLQISIGNMQLRSGCSWRKRHSGYQRV